MAFTLPPSLQRDLHSVDDEVAWARALTPEQRIVIVAAQCRDAMVLLAMNPKRDVILNLRDPLPQSTIDALARLRRRTN